MSNSTTGTIGGVPFEEHNRVPPVPRPRPKPAYALVKIGTRKFRARILWDEWDSRKPDVFAVLGPRDVVIQCRRAQMTMLP